MKYWKYDTMGNKVPIDTETQQHIEEIMKKLPEPSNKAKATMEIIDKYSNTVEVVFDEMEQEATHSDDWKITPITNKWKQIRGENSIGIKPINGNELLEGL